MQSPQNIRVHREQRILELVWSADDVSRLPFRLVRQSCPCAVCVDEFTGRQLLIPESVPEDINLLDAALSGNYAMKFRWSDTHDSGLFTWDHLRRIDSRRKVDALQKADDQPKGTAT
jgi:DUF971 family protein